jgi:hypothetical protein
MRARDTHSLLDEVLELLSRAETPSDFNFQEAFLNLGCECAQAELLADYLPSACGRAFLREIKITVSETYQRANADGSWGPPTAFADDPLWVEVESFVESIRMNPARRKVFGLAAGHSAEVDSVSNALNAGQALHDLAGSSSATVFVAPLKHRS